MEDYRAPPIASALIESMRDIGYSFETALADIIDNSIAANASEIGIWCDVETSDPVIAILDNGSGMSLEELLQAMRPGSQNPLEDRDEGDLGRFGLGLKTASFSQCRRLTVVSRQQGKQHAACWDLEYVAAKDDWLLQILDPAEIVDVPFSGLLSSVGTLVVWESLDRLCDETKKTSLKDHIFEQLDRARLHLELVFHRFLSGQHPFNKTYITINGSKVTPFDPYHSKHPATIANPEERIQVAGAQVKVQSYVLPHHNKVSKPDWQKYAGDGGYLQNQGFYVYRAGRLIVHGTWFRLAKQTELTKLARVRVDIPTELDHLWKIDVKKASASPPLVVRQRLLSIIDKIAGASNRVYTHRGRRISDPNITPFWARKVNKNQIFYEINRDHPTMLSFMEDLDDQQAALFEAVLSTVEKSFPIDALFSDIASKPESVDTVAVTDGTLKSLVSLTVEYLRQAKTSDEEILSQISKADPFRTNWHVAEEMVRYELRKD